MREASTFETFLLINPSYHGYQTFPVKHGDKVLSNNKSESRLKLGGGADSATLSTFSHLVIIKILIMDYVLHMQSLVRLIGCFSAL